MLMSQLPVRPPALAELEALTACAAEGTLVAAAERLAISRPAVAKRIRNLEVLAGRPLLDRGARGVRLTDAGAALLAGARRILDERDVLVGLLRELRGDGPSAIAGLREVLGHTPEAARAAQRSEARLTETERVLELVLRTSSSGVAISDPETAVVYEVNEAFCRFVGRPRSELIGKPSTETGTWYDARERPAIVEQLRRTGALERVLIRVKRPDGTMRAGETSGTLVSLAGRSLMLSTVDDVTERRRVRLEHAGSVLFYRAITSLTIEVLEGKPVQEGLGKMLPALRASGEFSTAVLWDSEDGRAVSADGAQPWPELDDLLVKRGFHSAAVELLRPEIPRDGAEIGFALALPPSRLVVVLLSARILPSSAQALISGALAELATVVAASLGDRPTSGAVDRNRIE